MAFRLPDFTALPEANPRAVGSQPSYPQTDPGAVGLAALGKGISAAGGALASIGEEREHTRQKLNESNATLDLINRFVPLHTKIAIETDPDKIAEYRKELDDILPTSSQAIDDPVRRKAWMASHTKTILNAHADADKRLTGLDRDRVATDLRVKIDTAARTGVLADDPNAVPGTLKAINDVLDWGQQYGALSPEQRYALGKQASRQLLVGRATHLLNTGRHGEAQRLLDDNPTEIDSGVAEALRHKIDAAREKQGIAADIAAETGAGFRDKGYAGDRGAPDRVDNWETRHHNYGGLRKIGVPPAGPNAGGFQAFGSAEEGVAAISRQLDRYASGATTGKPLTTIRQIVSTWAPPNENPTATLISRASKIMGVDPDKPLDVADPAVKAKLIEATIRNEQGGKLPVNPAIIAKVAGVSGASTTPVADDAAEPEPTSLAPAARPAGMQPMFDVHASMQRTQGRVDRGEISQERANAINAGVLSWHNRVQAAQANERAAVKKRLSNGAAMLEDGRDFDYDPAEVRHFFPKEQADEFLAILDDAKESGQIMNGVRMASPSDLVRQEQEITKGLADPNPENYARRRKQATAFGAAIVKRQKAITDDPAGYVVQFSPEVAAKYAGISQAPAEERSAFFANYAATALSEQERLGVLPENRSVLPAAEAAQVASRISRLDPAKEDPAKALAGLASYYGDYWEPAFGDLVKAKLPGTYQVLATMTEKDQAVPAADLSQAIKLIAEKGGMSALKKSVPDDKQKLIDQALDAELEDFRESVGQQVGGARLYATVRDAVQSLAYYNAFRGQSETEAVRSAVDGIINAKYDFGSLGAGQVRVPKGSLPIIERATDVALAAFTVDQLGDIPGNELLSSDQRKNLWMDAIRAGGWVNNRDDTGVVLMGRFRNGAFHAVRRADGSRIEVRFADAPLLAKEAPDVPAVVTEGVQQGLRRSRSPAPGSTVLPGTP